jgi:sugar phosphate isomerase/epimerase
MELAVSTLFCLHRPLEEALADLLSLGTRNIELVDAGPHALSGERVRMLLDLKDSRGVNYSIHAPYADMNSAADDPLIRNAVCERLQMTMGWASELEARAVVFHPGNTTAMERTDPGMAWRLNLETVRRVLESAEERGVQALIENVPDPFPFVMKSADDFSRFFDEVGADARMVLDVAHANIRGETREFIRRFGRRIRHVHVSDNQGDLDTHLPIGEGAIDWEGTLQAIEASGYDGWVTIESYSGVAESVSLLRGLL